MQTSDLPSANIPAYLGRILDAQRNAIGTCFQVRPGVLVTAFHVVDDLGAGSLGSEVIVDLIRSTDFLGFARVAAVDPMNDLALLTTNSPFTTATLPIIPSASLPLQTPVSITGSPEFPDPRGGLRSLTAIGNWAGLTLRLDEVLLGRIESKAVLPGMSGAPVLSSEGFLVGVLSGRYNSDDGWARDTVWTARTESLQELMNTVLDGFGYSVSIGRAINSLSDAVAFEVHPAISVEGRDDLPVMPPYIRREHDEEAEKLALDGKTGPRKLIVFVGGSSTGKTRAAWEVIHRLPDDWALWHPIEPTRAEAVLRGLEEGVPPKTVIWLNELQLYLNPPEEGMGERVAASLRKALRDGSDEPLLMVGTLWPEHLSALTAVPDEAVDRHNHARFLLEQARLIRVPTTFGLDRREVQEAALEDPRMRAAVQYGSGRLAQFLSGARELIRRYRNATPAQTALLAAAADARIAANVSRVSDKWLLRAAQGYLSDSDWEDLDQDWSEAALIALHDLTQRRKATTGPLTRVRNRYTHELEGSLYELADFLAEAIMTERRYSSPPATFWETSASHVEDPSILITIANAAVSRARYVYAEVLYKKAVERGSSSAMVRLGELYEATERMAEAISAYRNALTHGQVGVVSKLAWALEKMHEQLAVNDLASWWLDHYASGQHSPFTVEDRTRSWSRSGYSGVRLAVSGSFVSGIAAQRARNNDEKGAIKLYSPLASGGDPQAMVALLEIHEKCGDSSAANIVAEQVFKRAHLGGYRPAVRAVAERRFRVGDVAGAKLLYNIGVKVGDIDSVVSLVNILRTEGKDDAAQQLIEGSGSPGEALLLSQGTELLAQLGKRPRQRQVPPNSVQAHPEDDLRDIVSKNKERALSLLSKLWTRQGGAAALRAVVQNEPGNQEALDNLLAELATMASTGDIEAMIEIVLRQPGDRDAMARLVNNLDKIDPESVVEVAKSQKVDGNVGGALQLCRLAVEAGHAPAISELVTLLVESGRNLDANNLKRFGLDAEGQIRVAY